MPPRISQQCSFISDTDLQNISRKATSTNCNNELVNLSLRCRYYRKDGGLRAESKLKGDNLMDEQSNFIDPFSKQIIPGPIVSSEGFFIPEKDRSRNVKKMLLNPALVNLAKTAYDNRFQNAVTNTSPSAVIAISGSSQPLNKVSCNSSQLNTSISNTAASSVSSYASLGATSSQNAVYLSSSEDEDDSDNSQTVPRYYNISKTSDVFSNILKWNKNLQQNLNLNIDIKHKKEIMKMPFFDSGRSATKYDLEELNTLNQLTSKDKLMYLKAIEKYEIAVNDTYKRLKTYLPTLNSLLDYVNNLYPFNNENAVCFTGKYFSDIVCKNILLQLIMRCKSSIKLTSYRLNIFEMEIMLICMTKFNVDVSIVVDLYNISKFTSFSKNDELSIGGPAKYKVMRDNGVSVYVDCANRVSHNKYIIFDNEVVLTGSYNFTKEANNINAENFVILQDKKIVKAFRTNFDLFKNYTTKINVGNDVVKYKCNRNK